MPYIAVILGVGIAVIWVAVTILLYLPGEDAFGVPFAVALRWPLLFISDRFDERVRATRRRMDAVDSNLHAIQYQINVPLDDENYGWHWAVVRDGIKSAREWLRPEEK